MVTASHLPVVNGGLRSETRDERGTLLTRLFVALLLLCLFALIRDEQQHRELASTSTRQAMTAICKQRNFTLVDVLLTLSHGSSELISGDILLPELQD